VQCGAVLVAVGGGGGGGFLDLGWDRGPWGKTSVTGVVSSKEAWASIAGKFA
jgi:hypothetical protein